MPHVSLCDECGGRGVQVYERGPAVERCTACGGVGVRFARPDTAAADFRDAITGTGDGDLAALGDAGALRALAAIVAELESRCAELERELGRRR